MKDQSQVLLELACEAKGYPPRSEERRKTIDNLVTQILKSNPLGHPQRELWPPNIYEELYREAVQKTWLYIFQHIDDYKPEYPVMAWVNFTLKNRFIEAVKEFRNLKGKGKDQRFLILSIDDLDPGSSWEIEAVNELESQKQSSDKILLRQLLQDDPENVLKSEQIKGFPEVTFQALAIAKVVEDKTWEQISEQFEISVSTLSSFFTRRLKKLTPYFQKYLQG